jgi:phytanoyl-CoA hydroxylase
MSLSPAQLEQLREQGFLVLPGFVARAECLRLRERAMALARELATRPDATVVFRADGDSVAGGAHASHEYFLSSGSAIRCFFEHEAFDAHGQLKHAPEQCLNKLGHAMHDLDPEFDRFSRTDALRSVGASIGIRDPKLLQSMYIFKQPHIGGEVACHTDHTYLWTEPRSVIGFWFAIDDATTENGCMWALPGGHRLPVKSRSRLDATRSAAVLEVFDPSPYPMEGLQPLEAERGSLILLDGALPHLSGPNRSEAPRHAYTLHVIDGTARYLDDNWLSRPELPLRGF